MVERGDAGGCIMGWWWRVLCFVGLLLCRLGVFRLLLGNYRRVAHAFLREKGLSFELWFGGAFFLFHFESSGLAEESPEVKWCCSGQTT